MKSVTLELTGWKVEGHALLNLWGGGQGTIEIKPTFVPLGQMTKENLHRCINDNGFGCESIEQADLWVGEVYGTPPGYVTNWRSVEIVNPRRDLVCRGI